MTTHELKAKLQQCVPEITFRSLRGKMKIPYPAGHTNYYQVLLKYPYYMEFITKGAGNIVELHIKQNLTVIHKIGISIMEQLLNLTYTKFLDLLVSRIYKTVVTNQSHPCEYFNLNKRDIHSQLMKHLGSIISQPDFRGLTSTNGFIDMTSFADNRMYDACKIKYKNRNNEYQVNFIYYKDRERIKSPYPHTSIAVEVEEARSLLSYQMFLDGIATDLIEKSERELYHVYWVIGLLSSDIATSTTVTQCDFFGSSSF